MSYALAWSKGAEWSSSTRRLTDVQTYANYRGSSYSGLRNRQRTVSRSGTGSTSRTPL